MPRHHHIVQIQQKPIRNRPEHRLIHVGLQKTAYDRFVPQGVCYQCSKDIFIGQRFKRTPFDDGQLLFDIRHPRINCSAAFSGFQHFIDNTGCIEFDTVIIILPLLDKTNLKYGILLPGNFIHQKRTYTYSVCFRSFRQTNQFLQEIQCL